MVHVGVQRRSRMVRDVLSTIVSRVSRRVERRHVCINTFSYPAICNDPNGVVAGVVCTERFLRPFERDLLPCRDGIVAGYLCKVHLVCVCKGGMVPFQRRNKRVPIVGRRVEGGFVASGCPTTF